MTLFVGDIHGEFTIFHQLLLRVGDYPGSIIQVGDFGHHPLWLQHNPFVAPPRPIYWIDGNHEYFPDLQGIDQPTELYPNCIYVPRGTVMEVDGRLMGFLGGADSIDKEWRQAGRDWWPEERVTTMDVQRLVHNAAGRTIDLLVTHAPPLWQVPPALIGKGNAFGASVNEDVNVSSRRVAEALEKLGNPAMVCGHFHLSYTWRDPTGKAGNVTVLDINEIKEL